MGCKKQERLSKYTCSCKYKDQRESYSLDVTDEKVYDGRKVMEQLVEQVL